MSVLNLFLERVSIAALEFCEGDRALGQWNHEVVYPEVYELLPARRGRSPQDLRKLPARCGGEFAPS